MRFHLKTSQYGQFVETKTHETIESLEQDLQIVAALPSYQVLGLSIEGRLDEDCPEELIDRLQAAFDSLPSVANN